MTAYLGRILRKANLLLVWPTDQNRFSSTEVHGISQNLVLAYGKSQKKGIDDRSINMSSLPLCMIQ